MANVTLTDVRKTYAGSFEAIKGISLDVGDGRFHGRIEAGILATAPAARISMLHAPPVVGAALLGLDLLAAGASAQRNVRGTLTQERFSDTTGGNSRGPHPS